MRTRQNEGPADRTIRLVLAVVFAYAATVVPGPWPWVAGALASVAFVTAIVGFCPTYTLLGIDTRGFRHKVAGSV